VSVRKRIWKAPSGEPREAWVVDYVDQQGDRHLKTFAKKRDADAHHAIVGVAVRAGMHTADSKSVTVAKAAELWLDSCEAARLERASLVAYRQVVDLHIAPVLGGLRLSQLTVPLVRGFEDRLHRDGRSASMVRRARRLLGAILADAQERGLVAQNVVRSLGRHKRRQDERRQKTKLKIGVDIPAREEIAAIIANLKGRWRPLILTAIFTGLRASELRGLRWGDVDLKKRELHVRQRADRFNGIGKPKSAAGERTVPMPPMLANALREWKLACPQSEHELVFPTGAGGVESHSNIVQRGLAPVQMAAGVVTRAGTAKYTGLHSLRHFYASWCINRIEDGGLGLPIKIVQHRLGHASIAMTSDTYGHLFPSGDDGAELAAAERAPFG
jgi:integrase